MPLLVWYSTKHHMNCTSAILYTLYFQNDTISILYIISLECMIYFCCIVFFVIIEILCCWIVTIWENILKNIIFNNIGILSGINCYEDFKSIAQIFIRQFIRSSKRCRKSFYIIQFYIICLLYQNKIFIGFYDNTTSDIP